MSSLNIHEMREKQVVEYFYSARERYQIYLNKKDNKTNNIDKPLTNDKAFLKWRFCNVFREDDKTTKWIRDNVRTPLGDSWKLLPMMVMCRFTNRIATLELLKDAGCVTEWGPDVFYKTLKGVAPVISSAYIIKTPNGLNKIEGIIQIVDSVYADGREVAHRIVSGVTRLEDAWDSFKRFKFFGGFMAYEIVSDLRHTPILDKAPDINTWACPGPGACRGLSWLVGKNLDCVKYTNTVRAGHANLNAMRKLLALSNQGEYWPQGWPKWEMREVEHWLCEYAKYVKIHHLGLRMKQKYVKAID